MTDEAATPVAPALTLDQAIARRDELVRALEQEVPRLHAELNQLIGWIAAKSETNGEATVAELPNRAARRAKPKPR